MSTPNRSLLTLQVVHAKQSGMYDLLKAAAEKHSLPVAYVLAIASRETNMVNELGDFQGGQYHGVGILQIDIQHDFAREMRDDGSWKTHPEKLIDWGCALLQNNIVAASKSFPHGGWPAAMKIAASGYNCGITRAIEGSMDRGDSDFHTTGKDYGRDVMARYEFFATI